MKNHQSRPIGSEPFRKVNAIYHTIVGVDVVIVVVVVMVVGRIPYTIIIILLTPSKGKTHFTPISGIMVRQNKKMEKVYIKTLQGS